MENTESRVIVHMAASLDGFIARRDGRVDWLETSDEFTAGETLDPEYVEEFLKSIDCYVMGSRTYETALGFEEQDLDGHMETHQRSCSRVASCRATESQCSFSPAI
jgi:dihydrofolate reductase